MKIYIQPQGREISSKQPCTWPRGEDRFIKLRLRLRTKMKSRLKIKHRLSSALRVGLDQV
eukprot:58352-Amorphochlora_amoeboformis.AAC.1